MDLDDLVGQLFGQVLSDKLGRSRRAQLVARLFFGLLGAGLGLIGCIWVFAGIETLASVHMRASMAAVFFFMACFFGANVGLARRWRWPALGFAASFVALIVGRLALGL